MERALREGNRGDWPIIVPNLDVKTEEREHLESILRLLREYQAWLSTAPKIRDITTVAELDLKPIINRKPNRVIYRVLENQKQVAVLHTAHGGG